MIAPVNPKNMKNGMASGNDARAVAADAQEAAARTERNAMAAAASDAPSGVEKALGVADSTMNYFGLAPILLGLTGFVTGSVPRTIGKWTGINMLKNFGNRSKALHEYVNEATFADVGNRLGIREQVGAVSNAVAGVAGSVTDSVGNKTGINAWLSDSHTARASRRFKQARETLDKLDINQLHEELRPHVQSMKDALNNVHVSTPVMETVAAGVGHGMPSAGMPHMPPGGMGGAGHPHVDTIRAALDKVKDLVENGREVVNKEGKTVLEKVKATGHAATNNTYNKFSKQINSGISHHGAAAHWDSPGKTIRKIPGNIGQTSVTEGIMHGSFIAGSAISMANDAYSFKNNLATLKQTYADMTGKKVSDVSTLRMLIGDVPAPLREARGKMIRSLFVSEAADAVGMAVNIKGARKANNWGFMKSTVAFMLPGMVSSAYNSSFGETWVPVMHELKKIERAGQPIPAEGYAALLHAASPEMRNRGEQDPFLHAVAQKYATEKVSLAEVMKRVENGGVMADVHALIKKYESEHHPANKAQGSHAARIAGQAQPSHRAPVGQHTERLAENPLGGHTLA